MKHTIWFKHQFTLISAEPSILQFSSLCYRNTTSVFYGANVISCLVCDQTAYAVTECIVVHGTSVGLVCAWFEACITYAHISSCMLLHVNRIVSSGNGSEFQVPNPGCKMRMMLEDNL